MVSFLDPQDREEFERLQRDKAGILVFYWTLFACGVGALLLVLLV